jgi:cytochrome bd-type quinol oxidase subunit 2
MKRTGEIVLGVIGAIFYGLGALFGVVMLVLKDQQDLLREISQDPEVSDVIDINSLVDTLSAGGWTLIITSLIALILGIIAIVFIKGNKKPKAAGIIFIVTAVVITIATFGAAIFPGIFFLIAGIMCLARKPQTAI